jgi:methionyl-tRNA formyltransferase
MANIVFMGTPEFAVPSLELLARSGHRPSAVVTAPDRPRGRGRKVSTTPVRDAAERLGVDRILQPESVKSPEFAREVQELNPDIIVVVAFSILPPPVFGAARLGAFNLHGSLLPRYRGAAPIHRAVMAGETETGVTTFFLKEKVDTGNVILQRRMPIGPNDTTGDVHDRMMLVGADAVLATVELILSGSVTTSAQDDTLATPAPKVFREECEIVWSMPRARVHDFIRGLSPVPGAWTHHGPTELKLFRSRIPDVSPQSTDNPPGTVVRADEHLHVETGDGHVEILVLQQQGRRRLKASEFLRGYALNVGDHLT